MAPKKSIFRQPGAKHFQLVHRSQRDPLIHDSDASQHVLKPFERENLKKGRSRVELEETLAPDDIEHDSKARVGEATLYGIYYDDSQYDYMQHLRPIGVQEDSVDGILIEAPPPRTKKNITEDLQLPHTVFASVAELPRNHESQQAIPESIAGFKPDMDPHLRQVLEALDDDAFVDDGLDDDFFAKLVQEGERENDEDLGFDFQDEGLEEVSGNNKPQNEAGPHEDTPWEERFAFFKKSQIDETTGQSDDESSSEGADTVGGLPDISVIGGKRRRRKKGASQASGYSMTSLSMYRNEALQTLDRRFEQLMLKEYNKGRTSSGREEDSDEAPELITSREDFEVMMNEFMTEYEILGKKMRPRLLGETGAEKLNTLRSSMGRDEWIFKGQEDSEDEADILIPVELEDKDRWDCETILSTYSNLGNHPRLIRVREGRPTAKIHLHPKTGLPTSETHEGSKQKSCLTLHDISEISDESEKGPHRRTITRPRNESKEDKRFRKDTIKAEKQHRRAAKKTLKEKFEEELQMQKKSVEARTKGRIRKL